MRFVARIAAFAVGCCSVFALTACGSEEVALKKGDPNYAGAVIFAERCAGCHTLSVAGTQGSSTVAKDKEITDGPNFNQRRETVANILYALENGGFSGKVMPQNLVTGEEAQAVAEFLAKYAGRDVTTPPGPKKTTPSTEEDAAAEDELTGTSPDEHSGHPVMSTEAESGE